MYPQVYSLPNVWKQYSRALVVSKSDFPHPSRILSIIRMMVVWDHLPTRCIALVSIPLRLISYSRMIVPFLQRKRRSTQFYKIKDIQMEELLGNPQVSWTNWTHPHCSQVHYITLITSSLAIRCLFWWIQLFNPITILIILGILMIIELSRT